VKWKGREKKVDDDTDSEGLRTVDFETVTSVMVVARGNNGAE
jgi:hypothetical protein